MYENIKIGNTFYKNMNLINYFVQISGRRLVNTFFHAITKKVKNFYVKVLGICVYSFNNKTKQKCPDVSYLVELHFFFFFIFYL